MRSRAAVTINLKNTKVCHKIILMKLTWDSRKKDEVKLFYRLESQTKIRVAKLWLTSNAGINMIIAQDKIIGLKTARYFKDARVITKYLELELQKLAEMLTLEKPCYVADPADSSSEFFA